MVPGDLSTFMTVCLEASASFIGLLFVGLSVVMQKSDEKLADTDSILAESSYAGLLNIFFVALVGTIPKSGIGDVSLIMALIGLLTCWRLRHFGYNVSLVISSIIYVIELIFAIKILAHPNRIIDTGMFETIIIALFSVSLLRAWGLTGIREPRGKK